MRLTMAGGGVWATAKLSTELDQLYRQLRRSCSRVRQSSQNEETCENWSVFPATTAADARLAMPPPIFILRQLHLKYLV